MGKRLRAGGKDSVSQSLFRSIWACASAARTPLLAMSLTYWVPVSSFGLAPSRLPADEREVSSGQGGGFNGDLGRDTVGPRIMGWGNNHNNDGEAH